MPDHVAARPHVSRFFDFVGFYAEDRPAKRNFRRDHANQRLVFFARRRHGSNINKEVLLFRFRAIPAMTRAPDPPRSCRGCARQAKNKDQRPKDKSTPRFIPLRDTLHPQTSLLYACHILHSEFVLISGFYNTYGYGELSFARISMAAMHLELARTAVEHASNGAFR